MEQLCLFAGLMLASVALINLLERTGREFALPAALAVVTLAVGIVGGQAIADRSRTKEMMATRALTECSDAVNQVNNLSRSGGSDTAGALGKIRANIKAVETMSTMRQSLYGGALAPQSTFNDLYAIIDSYSAKLKNGSSTIDDLTRLGEVLTGLQLLLQDAR